NTMATAVLPPPPSMPDPNSSGGSFSPLTLFECTMTNAGMLVDSMPVRDLVSALRIIGTLHTHVVNIMDPGVASVCDLADQFNSHRIKCPAAAAETAATSAAAAGEAEQSPTANSSLDGGGNAKKRLKLDDNSMASSLNDQNSTDNNQTLNNTASAAANVKSESVAESDDDCCILDDGGLGLIGSDFYTSMQQQQQQQHQPRNPQISSAASASAAPPYGGPVQDSAAMKQILRNTYKAMRAGGPHLYDFNRPWNDPLNQSVTERIVSQIVATTPDISVSPDDWRSGIDEFVRTVLDEEMRNIKSRGYKRRYSRITAKLSRRQKAFEQVLPSLNPDDLDKYRVVLSRDFTSSDEETEDESTGETALRVRELVWESEEVRQVKQRLDQTFMNRFATQKQRATLQRCIRNAGCTSSRTPPAEAPDWALRAPE
ncbi:hypothetical protein BOX15_Mlig033261g1, partial [Macrostomum lignano]